MRAGRLALCLAVVAACGGDDGGRPSVDVNEDNVCAEAAAVLCYNMYRCCSEGEIEAILRVDEPRSEEQCRADVEILCERGSAQMQWSVDEGRVTVDVAAIDACLEAVIAPDGICAVVATTAPWEAACEPEQYVGAVAVGGTCLYHYECAGEAYCGADRMCAALPVGGEPCSTFGCAQGFYCDGGTCAALVAAGAPCANPGACQEGLFCDFDATPQPECAALRAVGESCTADRACESLVCVPGVCASNGFECFTLDDCSGTCQGTGEFCFGDFDCNGMCSLSGNFCFDTTDCTGGAGDTCVRPPCERECVGEPFCGESYTVFDYCEDAAAVLP